MRQSSILENIKDKLNHKNEVFYLIGICVLVRLFIYLGFQVSATFPDSITYETAGRSLLGGKVDILRTPIYPMVINFFKWVGGDYYLQLTVFFQSIISLVSIYWFYQILQRLITLKPFIVASTLFYGTYPSLVTFDLCLLTESLSISILVFALYLFILNENNYSNRVLGGLLVIILLGVFLRPTHLIFTIALLMVWITKLIIKWGKDYFAWIGLFGIGLLFLLVLGYSKLNQNQNGYYGISSVSNNNQMEILLQNNLCANNNDTALTNFIIEHNTDPHSTNHNDLLELIYKNYNQERVKQFVAECKSKYPFQYYTSAVHRLVKLGSESTFVSIAKRNPGLTGKLVIGYLMLLSFEFWFVYIILLGFAAFLISRWKYEQQKFEWMFIWLYSTILLIAIVVESYGEYQRLYLSAIPLLLLMIVKVFEKLVEVRLKKN